MEVRMVDPATLVPHPQNPRTGHAVGKILASIKEFGFTNPVLVQKGTGRIIAGHGRVKAAVQGGVREVPVIDIDISDKKALSLMVADNRIGEESSWEKELLKQIIVDLKTDENFDLKLTGLDPKDLLKIDPPDFDDAPDPSAPPKNPRAMQGDVFQIGPHRLMCGDSSKIEDVRTLMGDLEAHLVYSDPPYGILYDGGVGSERPDAYQDEFKDYQEFLASIYMNAFEISDDSAPLMIWFASKRSLEVLLAVKSCGYELREILIWNKPNAHYGALGCQYKIRYEPCVYAFKRGKTPRFYGGSDERNLLDVPQPTKNDLHPTMKPISLYASFIKNHTEVGHIVYEPFGGSGTTFMACEQLSRVCFGMEISPAYCDVIIKRWCQLTGADEETIYESRLVRA